MKAERNALQERVFPRIRDRCRRQGFGFQAIDLRWGVSEEADLDQQTLNICLREIQRCQKVSPRPNFIVLLGDRYGWTPLPPRVDAAEFELVVETMTEQDRRVVARWYRKDENAIPPHYILLPREREFADIKRWEPEERQLLSLLRLAAGKFFRGHDDAAWGKYFQSATHQEVIEGILGRPDTKDRVFAYLRDLTGLPKNRADNPYLDSLPDGSWDEEAWRHQQALKDELQSRLPAGQVRRFRLRAAPPWFRWNSLVQEPDADYIDTLCRSVETDLAGIIEEEIADQLSFSVEEHEESSHLRFAEERARHFVGRDGNLRQIEDYLAAGSPAPLVVRGESGSGKTALLAKAYLDAGRMVSAKSLCLARFIGATPGSTNLRSVLTDLGRRIGRVLGVDLGEVPGEMHRLEIWFHQHLTLASRDRPLILFLDAIDQFSGTDDPHRLSWVPRPLPEYVRIVISVLERSGDAQGLASAAARRMFPETMQVSLSPLGKADGETLLRSWLGEAGRTLQELQFRCILDTFVRSGLPLWLRLAFDQTCAWRSFDEPQNLPTNVPRLIAARLDDLSRPENHGPVLVRKALGYLAAARRGLSEDELLDILALDEECWTNFLRRARHELPPGQRRLPAIIWARLLGDLEHSLAERRSGNSVLLDFYHRELGECVASRFLGADDRHRFHETLTTYFEGQETWGESPVEQRLDQGSRPVNPRKADELPWQRIQWVRQLQTSGIPQVDQALEGLGSMFCRLEFLESKAEGGLIFDLVAEITEAANLLEVSDSRVSAIRLLAEALRRDSHFISRHPATLFQCLWNLCWWHDCPEAARHREDQPDRNMEDHRVLEEYQRWWHDCPEAARHAADPPDLEAEPSATTRIDPGLHQMLEAWRDEKESGCPGFLWIRSLRPPNSPLGQGFISRFETGEAAVHDVAFSSDERRVVASCGDGSMRVWDFQDGRQLQCLRGASTASSYLVLSQDGERAFSGSEDGQVSVWNLVEGVESRRWQAGRDRIRAIALSPDGHSLATGHDDGAVVLWNAEDGKVLHWFTGHQAPVNCLRFAHGGDRLCSASGNLAWGRGGKSKDNSTRIWSLRDGGELMSFRDHEQCVTCCAFSRDGKRLFSGSWDETVRVRDLEAGTESRVLGGYVGAIGPVTDLKIWGDDSWIASTHLCHNSYGYYTAPLRFYDLTQDREVLQIPEASNLERLTPSSSGRFMGVLSAGTIRVFQTPIANATPRLRTTSLGMDLTLSPSGQVLMWRNAVVGVGCFGCSGWDLETWKDLPFVRDESIESAIKSAQYSRADWNLKVTAAETCLTERTSGAVAWYPQALEGATSARNGRMWVAKQGGYIHLIIVEGWLDG